MNRAVKLGILVLLMIQIVILVEPTPYFEDGPWIEDFYGNIITSIRSSSTIYCKWNASSDTVSYNISWYNNGVYYPNSDTPTVIPPEATHEEETWNCTVTLIDINNNTNTSSTTVEIVYDPVVFISEDGITYSSTNNNYTIREDQVYYMKWNTTSIDFVSASITNDGESLCLKTGSVNKGGIGTCSPTAEHLSNGLNSSYNRTVDFSYSYISGTQTNSIKFDILPVNDKPDFELTTDYFSVNETHQWIKTIEITDEEGNFPINFTTIEYPSFCNHTNTNRNIMIDCNPDNGDAQGFSFNYTINITIEDSPPTPNAFNLTPESNSTTLTLEVFRINHIPEITAVYYEPKNQTEFFTMIFNATDAWDHNNMSFAIESECNEQSITNPWTDVVMTFMNNSGYNASGIAHSYATGQWNGTLTNDHIICREIAIIVNDTYETENNITFTLNISNINDQVELHNFSHNALGTSYNKYIYNLTAYELSEFKYQINATDPDLLILYNATLDSFQEALTYTSNSSWLNEFIGATGLITIPGDNLTENMTYTFNITVTDNGPTNTSDSEIMILRVIANTKPYFNQSGSNQLQFYCNETDTLNYNHSCIINFSQYIFDADQNDTIVSITDNSSTFNFTNGYMNLSIPQNFVGNHTFNVTASDSRGAISITNLTLTIYNTNNRPTISNIVVRTPPDTGLYYNQPQNNHILISVSDLDLNLNGTNITDLNYDYERLRFIFVNNNASQNVEPYISIVPNVTNNTSNINLIINTTKSYGGSLLLPGNYSINITVIDNYENFTGTDSINNYTYPYSFQIYNSTSSPDVRTIYPYGTPTTLAWLNITITQTSYTNINVSENTTLLFNQTSWYDPTSGYSPSYHWFYDNVELNRNSNPNYNSSVQFSNNNQSIMYRFGFFEANMFDTGHHNLTFVIKDGFNPSLNDTFTWRISVNDTNRPIVYMNNSPIANVTVVGSRNNENEDLWRFNNLSGFIGFYDPDYDYNGNGIIESGEGNFSITYNVSDPTCQNYLTFQKDNNNCTWNCELGENIYTSYLTQDNQSYVSGHGFFATAEQNGTCLVNFTASDGFTSATSRPIAMFVTETGGNEPETEIIIQSGTSIRTVTETKTIPVPEEIEKPVYIDIVIPDMVTVYENNTIKIPLKIINTWTQPVYGVKLSYIKNGSFDYTIQFERTDIYRIDPGEEIATNMIVSNYRIGGIYEILVVANVTDPKYQDFAKIYLNSLEQTTKGAEVRTLVRFAQDLLKKNKECQELAEILQKGEEKLAAGQTDEAIKILESMINGCKYLISEENKRPDARKSIRDFHLTINNEIVKYGVIALALIIIGSLTGYLIWRKKNNTAD